MSDDTTNKPAKQTSMFSIENAAPQIHNAELGVRRVQIDGTWFFSVIDIFKLYGDTTDARQEWKTVEGFLIKQGAIGSDWSKRSDVKNTQLLMHKFEGQGQRLTPIATFKMIMRIAQVTTFQGWEEARDQMAQLAEERVEETRNPELGVRRAHARFIETKMAEGLSEAEAYRSLGLFLESKEKRVTLTDALKAACIEELARWQYAKATNTQYDSLFHMTAKEISEATGAKVAKDGLTDIGRQILMLSDMTVTEAFRNRGKAPFEDLLSIAREICDEYGLSVQNIESRLGISIVTGRKLLGRGS